MAIDETIRAMMKARRQQAHGWLKSWAKQRERIGAGVIGPMGRIRDLQDGAGSCGGGDPSQPNGVERQADLIERTMRVERFVRMMEPDWIIVLVEVYLHGQTQGEVAQQLGIERNRVVCRLQDAQERLVREFEAEDIARVQAMVRGFGGVLVDGPREVGLRSACNPVYSEHLGVVRPKEKIAATRPA